MFHWHNYGKSTIGARADVENVDIARLQAFYRLYYQPDNATLIVSGRFDARAGAEWVAELVRQDRRSRRAACRAYTLDPVQDGERSVTVRRVGGVPLLHGRLPRAAGAHPDYAAVEVLTLILGDTPSGRLHKRLIEKQLAAGTSAFALQLADPGAVFVGARARRRDRTSTRRAPSCSPRRIAAREPVTAEELSARRSHGSTSGTAVHHPETVGVALSESVAQGDWRLFFLLRDRVAITLADVQRVASEYLLPRNRTLGAYLPTDSAAARAGAGTRRRRGDAARTSSATAAPPRPRPSTRRRPTSTRAPRRFALERHEVSRCCRRARAARR